MIDKISLTLMNESGNVLPVKETDERLEIKIEVAIADLFSSICYINNDIKDKEIKIAEKFSFAVYLRNYLEEINNGNRTGN